jgi:hypothetical protein
MVDFLQYIFVKRGFVTLLVGQEKVLSFAVNVKYDVGSTSGFWVSFGGPSARFSTLASRRVPGFSNAKNRKVGQLKSPGESRSIPRRTFVKETICVELFYWKPLAGIDKAE